MKTPIDQLIESANEVRLTSEASKRMRENLVAYLQANPVSESVRSPYQRIFSILSPFSFLFRIPVLALMLLSLIILGGATTFAAAGALPGDILYPLKVNVLEPAKGVLAVSQEARAKWQVSRAETRIHEVEQLAAKRQLTPEEGAETKENFDNSLHAARVSLEKLSRHNPEAAFEIETSFAESLNQHEETLNQLGSAASSTSAEEVHSFAKHVKTGRVLIQDDAEATTPDSSPKETEKDATRTERDRTPPEQHEQEGR